MRDGLMILLIAFTMAWTSAISAEQEYLSQSALRFGAGGGRVKVEAASLHGSTSAWDFFGGFEFNPYFAVEAGYLKFGKAKDVVADVVFEDDTKALYASVIASFPLDDDVDIYARLGLLDWETDREARQDGVVLVRQKTDGNDLLYGGGIAAMIDEALLRLEYRVADLDDSDLRLISLAVAWRF
jgi:OmpA-OmpF porin, OOP family